MKKWIQKTMILAVALLTFGVISPSHAIWENLLEEKSHDPRHFSAENETYYPITDAQEEPPFLLQAKTAAKEQAYIKFGSKIGPVIEDEFNDVILPKIEEAIELSLASAAEEQPQTLAITEKPAGDYSEKIFHIYDTTTNKDVIRFHVRTLKKPQDGYFFNFHYHKADDQFSKHYALGDIYWSKNTPPKWLS
jgi:hypothetical protein